MKIGLHELKHLVAQIINEGKVADDLKVLQQRYPNEADALASTPFIVNGQPTKWFKNWLLPRFLPDPPKEEFPLDHAIDSVQSYAQNEQALNNAFRQQAFKEALVAALPESFNLNKINDSSQLNVREMDSILEVFSEYNEKKNDRLGIDYDAIDVEGDKLGKIGPWNIWMPTTRETSCTIVRVRDPKTGKMKKSPCSWCTIRTDGSNLFYNYTARPGANIILYYLIRDNPEINNPKNEDFISIGFLNGVPDMTSATGGITVRCDNAGLKEEDLKRIFGVDYTSIINLLTQKTKEVGGQHPAKTKLVAATQSLEGLNYLMKGISREERAELATQVLSYGQRSGKINPDVESDCFKYAAASKEQQILQRTAGNSNCPPHILEKLFNDDNDPSSYVAHVVLTNPNCPPHIKNNWELLSNHKNVHIRNWVAQNTNCPPRILEKLFNDDNDSSSYVAYVALKNPNCPPHIKNNWELLVDHKNQWIREWVASNRQCPPEILIKISLFDNKKDPSSIARLALAQNSACPLEALENLVKLTKRKDMKKLVIKHPNCSPEILRNLSRDPDPQVASAALKIMKKRKIQLESLRRKISKLIYAVR